LLSTDKRMMDDTDTDTDRTPLLSSSPHPTAPVILHPRRRDSNSNSTDLKKFVAEFIGTFVFLLLGLGATTSSVVTGAQSGIWQSAVVWGLSVSLCVYATSGKEKQVHCCSLIINVFLMK
jgi:hypothetical protein